MKVDKLTKKSVYDKGEANVLFFAVCAAVGGIFAFSGSVSVTLFCLWFASIFYINFARMRDYARLKGWCNE